MQTYEGVGAAWMPHPSFGWVTVVADPNVCFEIFQFIVSNDLVSLPHDLQNHHVLSVRKDEGFLFAERSVEFLVQCVAVLIDELVLGTVPFG